MKTLVLVTGGTGFVASHCILTLLNAGHAVRTTVRSLDRKAKVIAMMKKGGASSVDDLSFVEADLTKDAHWEEAVKGCEYVMHVASPVTLAVVKNEDDVIRPAVDGTLRVLRAAKTGGVKRIVLTSSFAAIGYGHNPGRPFTEEDWSNPKAKGLSTYVKSKILSERAAWDFMQQDGSGMELTVINPMAVLGPLLGTELSGGHELLKPLLNGTLKACPKLEFGIVDVRDVADLHLKAMMSPKAAGQRFLALAGGSMSLHQIAMNFRKTLGEDGKKVTTKVLPDWLVRFAALFNAKAKQVVPMLGQVKEASNQKAKSMLGWDPRSNEEAILAAAKSILELS